MNRPLPPPLTRRLFAGPAAAAYLSVSYSKFKELAKDGHFPKVHIDACVRYDMKDLDAFIEHVKAAS
jgi:predicted DNA-binding transcriptional regulator AlpA